MRRAIWLGLCLAACGKGGGIGGDDASLVDAAPGDAGVDAAPADASPDAAPAGACPDFTAERRAYFGDLHVHTSYSFDSYGLRNTRSGPREAYEFAKGNPMPVSPFDEDGMSTRGNVQLPRPLDFAAVTDHSEFLGEVSLCTDSTSAAYDTPSCRNFRTSSEFEDRIGADVSFFGWGLGLLTDMRPGFCDRQGVDCVGAAADAWNRIQQINEEENAPCTFTALHAYEYTGQTRNAMTHRNVIFRNAHVPARPITYFDARDWVSLARALKQQCNDAGTGCEALAIPHNSNYSSGLQFRPVDGAGNPYTAETARLKQEMEPLVEITQTKSESECRNGFTRYAGATDELCDFEKKDARTPACQPGETPCQRGQTPDRNGCVKCLVECEPGAEGDGCMASYDYVRNALKVGLEQLQATGVNPFRLGFIGSTDTHNATPGRVEENTFEGHHGFQDDEPDELLVDSPMNALAIEPNPGGLAAVWAEQNTRDAIFDALKRRETFATSGPRMTVRFFAGPEIPADLCDRADFVSAGYAHGVPMGGGVPAGGTPRFALKAMRDPDGAQLQRIQIVKVWIDADGHAQENVYDVTPDPDYTADVDLATCTPHGPGHDELCAVWTDAEFDAAQPAAWYARVVEVPTCRWNQWLCLNQHVDCNAADPPDGCCDPDVPKTIQERAWTSPVYWEPAR
jgi:hypothetical protein